MGYRIEGDGSYRNTKITLDGALISEWHDCTIKVDKDVCKAVVNVTNVFRNLEEDSWLPLDRIVLSGIYAIVGDGDFSNTRIIVNDEPLRGVQSFIVTISKDDPPMLQVVSVYLPNLVEGA
jgi:hypothetical protein